MHTGTVIEVKGNSLRCNESGNHQSKSTIFLFIRSDLIFLQEQGVFMILTLLMQ